MRPLFPSYTLSVNLYVKLQLDRRNETVVISFKSDESR